jgi:hypothetical protein
LDDPRVFLLMGKIPVSYPFRITDIHCLSSFIAG